MDVIMLNDNGKHKLTCLPMVTSLPSKRLVVIDYMTDEQLTETYHMIQQAAENSEGYGIDEFDSDEDFRHKIAGSDCFAITCQQTGDMLAGFLLAVSSFYRGSSGVADPFIIVKQSERRQKLGEFAMRTAIDFARLMGYMAMYVDTFSNNIGIQRILENIGEFHRVGFLPLGGRLHNGEIIGSVIYYYDLNGNNVNLT